MARSVTLRKVGWALLVCLPTVAVSQPDDLISRLELSLPEWLAEYQVPGISVAIIRDAQPVWSKGFGLADVQSGRLMRSGTVLQAGPLSQSITAWGVMKLAEERKIDLNAPVEQYLQRWKLPLSPYKHSEVTVRRLLNHSAGILSQSYPPRRQAEERPDLKSLLSGIADDLPPVRVVVRPGSEYRYSDPGYSLLEMLIEEVSADSFSQFIEREILQPLNMQRSDFSWETVRPEWRAAPHDRHGNRVAPFYADQRAAFGLNSTADDLARFVAANLPSLQAAVQGYPVLTKETIERMQRLSAEEIGQGPSGNAPHYSLGWQVEQSSRGYTVISQGGFIPPGWQAQIFAVPQTGDGLVILANGANGLALVRAVTKSWAAAIGIGNLHLLRRLRAVQWQIALGALLTALLALGLGIRFLRQAQRGERRPATRYWPLRAAALLGLGSCFLLTWNLSRSLLPYRISLFASWLTVLLFCLCVVLALMVLFPRRG